MTAERSRHLELPIKVAARVLHFFLSVLMHFDLFQHPLEQGCQTHFHRGHISLAVAFKGLK